MLASRLTFPASSTASRRAAPAGAIARKDQERQYWKHAQQRNRRQTSAYNSMRQEQINVCKFWLAGRCTRRSCPYVHPPITTCAKDQRRGAQAAQRKQKAEFHEEATASLHRAAPRPASKNKTWRRGVDEAAFTLASLPPQKKPSLEPPIQQCPSPAAPSIQCMPVPDHLQSPVPRRTLSPSNSSSDGAANHTINATYDCSTGEERQGWTVEAHMVANLSGHDGAAVTGLVLPRSSPKLLFSAGKDAALRAWDCGSGLCLDTLRLAQPPNCLFNSFTDPDWLFVGLAEEVRVCNVSTHSQQALPVSSAVLSVSSSGDLLAAGLEDGSILVWRFEPSSASFQPFRCLSVPSIESSPVSSLEPCLAPGCNAIYAGSLDGMLRVWDLASGTCLQALRAHDKAITRLLACEVPTLLVSASQDGTIKLWKVSSTAPAGHIQLSFQGTFNPPAEASAGMDQFVELQGTAPPAGTSSSRPQPLAMCGIIDKGSAPVLFAAFSDSRVHILEVPSFKCKGTIRTESPVQAMEVGSRDTVILGSSKGDISVWKWK